MPNDIGRSPRVAPTQEQIARAGAGIAALSMPNVYNFSADYLLDWRAGKQRVLDGTGRAKVAWVGPSTIAGTGAGDGANYRDGMRKKALPYRVAEMLTARGLPCFDGSFWGTQHYFSEVMDIDPRISIPAGWVESTAPVAAVGGEMFRHNDASTNLKITFTPDVDYNAADVYIPSYTNFRNVAIDIDGVNVENSLGDTTPQGMRRRTFTSANAAALSTPGKYPIAIGKQTVQSGSAYLCGIDTFDTTNPKVSMLNMGWGGSDSADWADATYPFSPLAALVAVDPDLTIIELGPNDQQRPTDIPTFTARLTAMVTAALSVGDCILVMAPKDGLVPPTGAPTEMEYRNAMLAVAVANGCVFVDLFSRWPEYSVANALGWFRDTVHPSSYQDQAAPFVNLLLA